MAVATIANVKVFSVRRRKGDEKGTLRVQKLDVPPEISDDGARLVNISPDSRWLCVVRPNNDICLARIEDVPAASQEKPRILPQFTKAHRVLRHSRHEKPSHGTLGQYERTIRCVVFSEDSKLLASGDLSGCIDAWALEKVEDSSSASALTAIPKTNGTSAESDGESSDDNDDDEDEENAATIEGERWRLAAPESPMPRLKSGILLLSFRPQTKHNSKSDNDKKFLTNGVTEHQTSGPLPREDRLMALTSEHQLVELEALTGKLSEWSRRNPKACLPSEFRGVKDRAMGAVWDVFESRERLWLYGSSWMWMFDMSKDFPSPEEMEAEAKASASSNKVQKRKHDDISDGEAGYEEEKKKKKPNSGAGDKIPQSKTDISLGPKIRKIVGSDDSQAEWISLENEQGRQLPQPRTVGATDEDEDEDEEEEEEETYEHDPTTGNEAALARLRRGGDINDNSVVNQQKTQSTAETESTDVGSSRPERRWWHTYKYRDILGIVPLSSGSVTSDVKVADGAADRLLEVAIIERPMWDVNLPGRYVRDYE